VRLIDEGPSAPMGSEGGGLLGLRNGELTIGAVDGVDVGGLDGVPIGVELGEFDGVASGAHRGGIVLPSLA
jgi:hypothetical protein